MPIFETPEPVHAVIDVAGAVITVRAGEPGTTIADVRPHNAGRSGDTDLAGRTTVGYADGVLRIEQTGRGKSWLRNMVGMSGRVDVIVTVPRGSSLETRGWGDITTVGELGDVDVDSGMGNLRLDHVGAVRARSGMGDIRVENASGPAELKTAMGTVEVRHARADVDARTATGDVKVGDATGELRLNTSAGDVRVLHAGAGVEARTSAGDIRLQSVRAGSVSARTSYGHMEIGVAHGTAAWLDVQARHGVVRSELSSADGPGDAELTVEIHATTGYGDIVLRRAG